MLDTLLWYIINFDLLSYIGYIFSNMLYLLIICIDFFYRDVVSLSYFLIFCNRSCDRDILCCLLCYLFYILSLIRNLNIGNLWFIISVCSLNWNILYERLSLWLRLLVNGCWLLDYWLNNA